MSHKNCLNRLKNTVFFFVLLPLILIFSFTYLLSDTIYAQTADKISLQGKIVRNDSGYEGLNVVNGTPSCVNSGPDTCNFQVKYYSASSAGDLYFTETFSGVEIGDYGGVFNLKLGSGSSGTSAFCVDGLCNTVYEVINDFNTVYIEISFDPAGGTSYGEVFTRTPLNASAYSIKSKYAEGSADNAFKFYKTDDYGETFYLNPIATTGSVYYNTDDNELKLFNGTSWVALSTASGLWTQSTVAGIYDSYMAASGTGAIGTFDDFTLDLTNDRLSINTAQAKGGLTVYSSYDTAQDTAWPLVSFKAEGHYNFDASVLELTQDGTGDILMAYHGSTPEFQIDNYGDMHLATNGIAYFEHFTSAPTSGDLHPNEEGDPASSIEGCLYSVSGSLYWDPTCEATSAIQLGSGSTSLWTESSTFTYLTSTTDDVVLGASTTSSPPFFFDVSEGRLGIGTGTPQAAIDIAGASSTIANTSGDITITPAGDLVVIGDVLLGEGTTTRALYAYNAAETYYGKVELYNLATGNMTLTTTFDSGDIILTPGSSGGVGIGTTSPGQELDVFGDIQFGNGSYVGEVTNVNNSGLAVDGLKAYLKADNINVLTVTDASRVGISNTTPSAKLDIVGTSDIVQLSVKGYSTQTNNLFEVIKSDDSDLMTLSNAGLLTLSGNFQGGTNNSYDIGNTSTRWKDVYTQGSISIGANGDSGGIRYNTTDNQLEFTNDGSTWIPMAGATKTVTLSAEYPGAVLAADGSANVGFMTSDAEGSASNSMNYYEWNSSEASLQDYDVRLRFTIPSDFASWSSTNAINFHFATEANSSTNNKVDFNVYEENSTYYAADLTNYSATAGVWTTTAIDDSLLIGSGSGLADCDAAGETCVFIIRMYSANDNYVRVGDIDLNYNRKL